MGGKNAKEAAAATCHGCIYGTASIELGFYFIQLWILCKHARLKIIAEMTAPLADGHARYHLTAAYLRTLWSDQGESLAGAHAYFGFHHQEVIIGEVEVKGCEPFTYSLGISSALQHKEGAVGAQLSGIVNQLII